MKRGHEVWKEFKVRLRLVVRDFKDREGVVRAYEAWSGEKVTRPKEL